ncbi:MAG: hypothetical protein PHT07_08115 [Paludibacter sp.]|nr:hypothetical protein [Paludibacter sp.]
MKIKIWNYGSFYRLNRFIVVLMLICVGLISAIESYAQYTCNITPISGGGFVTGVITHQTIPMWEICEKRGKAVL